MQTEWAAAAMKLLLWSALMPADIDLPPSKYDRPYRGQIEFVYDFPLATDDGNYLWGYTVPPKRAGGKCLVHLSPVGSVVNNEVMTEEVWHRMIRHELGHCNGWRH
jgi:hypothetical protein